MNESTTMPGPARILIFTRYPVEGQVKTRLIPALGPETAARLHRRMTEHVVAVVRGFAHNHCMNIHVAFTGAPRKRFCSWLGHDLTYIPQTGADLGRRMYHGLSTVFQTGPGPMVVVGSDLPDLDKTVLADALNALMNSDMVIGPSADGGYYLIGMHRPYPELFENMDWGSSSVFARSIEAASRLGLRVAVLPLLHDVDRPEDLDGLRHDPRFTDAFTGRCTISIIIPCFNEEQTLPRTLKRLHEEVKTDENLQIIVADGGSRDATCDIAARFGALVVQTQAGRAAQQNIGAAHASGRLLIFLHADTLLPSGFAQGVRNTLADPAVVAGAFRLRADSPRPAMRLIELAANIRSSALQYPYGDQGLFMEARVFRELGGFALMPIMEDFEFVRRLRRRGRIVTRPEAVRTSSRRWDRLGILRTFAVNQMMIASFLCGVSSQGLARVYRGRRKG